MASGNFCTLNPLAAQGGGTPDFGTLSNGNLTCEITDTAFGTFGVTSGKWYWEFRMVSSGTSGSAVGWANERVNSQPELGYNSPSSPSDAQIVYVYLASNPMTIVSDAPKSGASGGNLDENEISQNDIIGVAADFDNDKWYFSINGSFDDMRSGQNPSTGSNPLCSASGGGGLQTITRTAGLFWFPAIGSWAGPTRTHAVNFGQDSTFSGGITAGGNADENGFGDFKYSVPTGFKAMCSGNLPTSSDIDPAQTDDDYSAKQFGVVTYTGNGGSNAITGLGFKPDLIWGFTRSGSQSKRVIDSTRGGSSRLYSDNNFAEDTSTATISEFGTDGFTATGGAFNNDSGRTCGAWCWKANGGVTSSNTQGSMTSTVQSSTSGGFSIVTYTGSGSDGTVGHGLSSAPEFVISKRRDGTGPWYTLHASAGVGYLEINSSAAFQSGSAPFGSSLPTTSVVGATSANSQSGQTFLLYCWHSVEGYSKFGKYTANSADNNEAPFIYTGFRPRLLAIKGIDTANSWMVFDTARETANSIDQNLHWDTSDVEATENYRDLHILSNGFKIFTNNGALNDPSGNEYIYCAWGDVPFKYNNTF